MVAEIYEVERTMWEHFKKHHYLSADISPFSTCFIAVIGGVPVAFASAITFPSGTVSNAWRGHRLVALPDFQGLGVGPRLSDWVASYFVRRGKRFFSKTAHPSFGEHREKSPLWRATSTNKKSRKASYLLKDGSIRPMKGYGGNAQIALRDAGRVCYSHEYIGKKE
jgi:GNAT superfamily N-acetyltransferase